MSPESLDSMLHAWAVYYLSELDEVSWHKISISHKIIEIGKAGIFSPGTKHQEVNYSIPRHIEDIQKAILSLPINQQYVIKIEYSERGKQQHKAKKLNLTHGSYRVLLSNAKKQLTNIL